MTITDFLRGKYNYDPTFKEQFEKYIDLWIDWYKGYDPEFHRYLIYNGRNEIPMHRHTLNMAKKCCEDWADLLFNERCKISLDDKNSNEALNGILNYLNFWQFTNRSIERSGASGTGAMIFSLDNINMHDNIIDLTEAKPKLSYVDAKNIFPLSWTNEKITECAFINYEMINCQRVANISVHKKNLLGNYVIYNHVFNVEQGSDNIIEEISNDTILNEFDTQNNIPWFVCISPNSNNNKQAYSPFGVSYFANSIDILKAIDTGFDSFINEIKLSRKRIFVRDDLIDYGEDGKQHPVFHATDIAVYTLPNGMDKNDMIQSENSEIRSSDLERYLKNALSEFAASVGFDSKFYFFENGEIKTATEVVSENNKMFRRKKKHELLLESALYDLIECIIYAMTRFSGFNISDEGLTLLFDDSIVEDTGKVAERALLELQAGVISVPEYRQKIFGEAPEIAKRNYMEVLNLINMKNITENHTEEIQENKTEIVEEEIV